MDIKLMEDRTLYMYRQSGVNEQFPRLTHCYLVATFPPTPAPLPSLPPSPPVNNAPPPTPTSLRPFAPAAAQDYIFPNHYNIPNQTNTTPAITYQPTVKKVKIDRPTKDYEILRACRRSKVRRNYIYNAREKKYT